MVIKTCFIVTISKPFKIKYRWLVLDVETPEAAIAKLKARFAEVEPKNPNMYATYDWTAEARSLANGTVPLSMSFK